MEKTQQLKLLSFVEEQPSVLAGHLWDESGRVRTFLLEVLSEFVAEEFRSDFVADMLEMIADMEASAVDRAEIARQVVLEAKGESAPRPVDLPTTVRIPIPSLRRQSRGTTIQQRRS